MTQQIKEQLEEVIKKNLPEEKIISNEEFNSIQEDYSCGLLEGEILGHNQCLSQINTSLIADEVLKVVVEKIEEEIEKYEPAYESEDKAIVEFGKQLLANLSTNKENKNNE